MAQEKKTRFQLKHKLSSLNLKKKSNKQIQAFQTEIRVTAKTQTG